MQSRVVLLQEVSEDARSRRMSLLGRINPDPDFPKLQNYKFKHEVMEFAAVIANGARDGREVAAVRVHRTLRAVRVVLDPGANDVLQSSQRDPKETLDHEAELVWMEGYRRVWATRKEFGSETIAKPAKVCHAALVIQGQRASTPIHTNLISGFGYQFQAWWISLGRDFGFCVYLNGLYLPRTTLTHASISTTYLLLLESYTRQEVQYLPSPHPAPRVAPATLGAGAGGGAPPSSSPSHFPQHDSYDQEMGRPMRVKG